MHRVHVPMSIDDLSIALACMAEVNITDAVEKKQDLQRRMTKILLDTAPAHYQGLVELGKIEPLAHS